MMQMLPVYNEAALAVFDTSSGRFIPPLPKFFAFRWK